MTSAETESPAHHLLFIACSYPPVGGTAARGNRETVKQLLKAGYRVTVIGADFTAYPRDDSLDSPAPDNRVFRFPADDSDTLIARARRFLRVPPGRVSDRWSREIFDLAVRIFAQDPPELVYTVFGHGSEHLAALKLRQQFSFCWVAEFRDPWVGNWIDEEYLRQRAISAWAKHLCLRGRQSLKQIVKTADMLLVESPAHRQMIVDLFGQSGKILVNYLGTDADIAASAIPPDTHFGRRPVIGFVGKTYFGYDQLGEIFIRALKQLESDQIPFSFVSAGDNFFPAIAKLEKLQNYKSLGQLPYPEAIGLVAEIDFSLVLIPEAYPGNINSKIYEAIQLGTPILGLVPRQGNMAELIETYRLGRVLPLSVTALTEALREVLQSPNTAGGEISTEAKHTFAKQTLMQPVLEQIGKLIR